MTYYKRFINRTSLTLLVSAAICWGGYQLFTHNNINPQHQVGEIIDSFNGVAVYFNGGVAHVGGRNITADGYNLGLKYQCVEFVKRYYYEFFGHKMPDSYGHARSFYDPKIRNGQINPQRGLIQYLNGGEEKPQVSDLIVYSPTILNRFGHVAIISQVGDDYIEIIQQNPGPFAASREQYALNQNEDGTWQINNDRIVAFLRMPALVVN